MCRRKQNDCMIGWLKSICLQVMPMTILTMAMTPKGAHSVMRIWGNATIATAVAKIAEALRRPCAAVRHASVRTTAHAIRLPISIKIIDPTFTI